MFQVVSGVVQEWADSGGSPETRKPARGGLLEVFRRLPGTGLDSYLVGRGNLKQVGIYLFWLVNNCLGNSRGIPVGTLRDLDFDGRCNLSSAPLSRRD